MTARAYFDHASTSPLTQRAREALVDALESCGNASSVHREGRRARSIVEDARSLVAEALLVHDDEIVFCGSGTEADNLALRGACWAAGGSPSIVTTAIEHEAVRRTARWLDAKGHARATFVAPDADGVVDAGDVIDAAEGGRIVSVMAVNNEVGARQPVEEMGAACAKRGLIFHVDAVQALGRGVVRPRDVHADLLALSAHKVGGPQGCGVLFVRRGVKLQPALTGGDQESGLRPGSESVALLAASARAISDAVIEGASRARRLEALGARLEAGLLALGGRLNGPATGRAPGFVNVSFDDVDGETLLQALDLEGFAVSTGSACTSGSVAPSHVLLAMGRTEAEARSAVRFSLGPSNEEAEVDVLLATLPGLLERVRAARHVMKSRGAIT